jgi:hypothetical protein
MNDKKTLPLFVPTEEIYRDAPLLTFFSTRTHQTETVALVCGDVRAPSKKLADGETNSLFKSW